MASGQQRVGEYVLQDRIAAGTFGEVWRAHHHVWTDQIVAVKIPTDSQYLRALQHEGIAIHGLHHANIVRAIGFDPYADPAYLAMEFVPGSNLRKLITNRTLSPADSVAILKQVLAGLGYAHAKGIVHRDVKPENILIHQRAFESGFAAEGVVKVADFGLGKATRVSPASIAMSASMNDPAALEIAGTLDYMSPEQRTGATVDSRTDLYACGVVLYEMLTGEKPAGTDVPSDLNPAIPKSLDNVFRRSYSRLDKRFVSAELFAQALDEGRLSPPPIPTANQTPKPPVAKDAPASRATTLLNTLSSDRPCPQCHLGVSDGDQFCMHCGVQLIENIRRCPKCGSFPDSADRFCIFCGQGLAVSHAVV